MGTIAHIQLKAKEARRLSLIETSSKAFQVMENLDELLSTYRPQSQVSFLNRHGYLKGAHPHLLTLIQQSRRVEEETRGAFDMTLAALTMGTYHFQNLNQLASNQLASPQPKEIAEALRYHGSKYVIVHGSDVSITKKGVGLDFGGIAKGFAVDRAMDEILASIQQEDLKIEEVQVSLSGDIRCWHKCWIKIQNPFEDRQNSSKPYAAEFLWQGLSGSQIGISTSGGYGRYAGQPKFHHLLDPRTGYSVSHLASLTLMGSFSNSDLDAWTTALSVMPLAQVRAFLSRRPSLNYLMVFPNGKMESNLPSESLVKRLDINTL